MTTVLRRAPAASGAPNRVGRRPIRVLHLSDKLTVGDSVLHGVTRLFAMWGPAFDATRFEVTFGSLRGWDRAADHLRSLGLRIICFDRGKFDPRTLLDLMRYIRAEGIDVLHLHGYGATTFGRMAGAVTRTPRIVHEHMIDASIPWYQRVADRVLAPLTSRSIAVSGAVKKFLEGPRGLGRHRVEVVYNGVALSPAARDDGARFRESCGIDPDAVVVATVGRLDPVKGHRYLLEAASRVVDASPDVMFVIVGDGELMAELKDMAGRLGIEERVVFAGYRSDVAAVLAGSDIKAISSLSEGFGLTVTEAMKAGVPVVATAVGGIPEILEDGATGLLVPSRDSEALAGAITDLARDPERRQRMGRAGRQASERFNAEAPVRRFEEIYLELAR